MDLELDGRTINFTDTQLEAAVRIVGYTHLAFAPVVRIVTFGARDPEFRAGTRTVRLTDWKGGIGFDDEGRVDTVSFA